MSDKSTPTAQKTNLPTAVMRPKRRVSLLWILPAAAVLFAGYLVYRTWQMRGTRITILFDDGHGLRPGDEVRYRGIKVGEIEEITLTDDGDGTIVLAALLTHADRIARQGTLFWIERPRIGPAGVSGLDTVLGPRYLAIRLTTNPDAPPRRRFVGLSDPPIVAENTDGDLEIILEAESRGSLQPGGPVLYRQYRIGTVLSVGLASDGSAVEARVHIQHGSAPLIREQTRFWDSGGVKVDVGISGVSMEVESLPSVMIGSVSLATPSDGGDQVRTGHRFALEPEFEEQWLTWRPNVAIGNELLPPGSTLPAVERARLTWQEGIFRRRKSRGGWVLPVEEGLLGPADLLIRRENAREGTSGLEVAGRSIPHAPEQAAWTGEAIAVLRASLELAPWPKSVMRAASEPEDCLIVAASTMTPIPLAAARIEPREGYWRIDEALSFDDVRHGSCVLSRLDGALVGILLVDDGIGRVALLPEQYVSDE